MEHGHANVWNKLAMEAHAASFQVSLFIKLKIVLAKLLSVLLPLTIFIHYLEHNEKKAILDYARLLEIYRDDEKARTIIINVIRQEIGHEWHMMEQIADRKLYIAKAREAIPAMTAGIIETLGVGDRSISGPCPDTRHRTDRAHRDVRRLDRGNVRLLYRVEEPP